MTIYRTPRELLVSEFGLTPKQADVLLWIIAYRAEHGMSPTIREIQAAFGVSINGVVCHLQALRKKRALKVYDTPLNRALVPTLRFIPVEDL